MKIGYNMYYLHFLRKCDDPEQKMRRNLYQMGKITRDAGFECADTSLSETTFTGLPGCKSTDLETEIYNVRSYYEEIGLEFEKTHARFPSGDRKSFDWKSMREANMRELGYAKSLGVKHFVVHADVYTCEYGKYNEDDAFRTAYEYLAPLVEEAKKCGVGIAVETLFEEGHSGSDRLRFTSTSDELIRIIDAFNDPIVSCCLDTGHAAAAFGNKLPDEIRKIGKRISCTHVHDNYCNDPPYIISYNGLKDLHQPIFNGRLDWEAIIPALKETGFDGAFTLELCNVNYPEALLVDNLSMIYKNTKFAVDNF